MSICGVKTILAVLQLVYPKLASLFASLAFINLFSVIRFTPKSDAVPLIEHFSFLTLSAARWRTSSGDPRTVFRSYIRGIVCGQGNKTPIRYGIIKKIMYKPKQKARGLIKTKQCHL